jgi:hypothetical protein
MVPEHFLTIHMAVQHDFPACWSFLFTRHLCTTRVVVIIYIHKLMLIRILSSDWPISIQVPSKLKKNHRNTSHRCLRSHLRAHVDLFLKFNLLRSTIVHNNAIQRATPFSPPKNAILFVVSPAKTCVYSSKFLQRWMMWINW